jgi:Domain of unknown function (DUF3846)
MIKTLHIQTDGTVEVNEYQKISLDDMQRAVGGLIECVSLPLHNVDMYCNEEGKIHGLDRNELATKLYVANYGPRDVIMGDVLITNGADMDGEVMSLTEQQIERITNA